jgi:hypothetical protein
MNLYLPLPSRFPLALTLLALNGIQATAAEPLNWKFSPGLTNRYRMTQETTLAINTGPDSEVKTDSMFTTDISWTVQKVNDDGSAVLKQTIDRMRTEVAVNGGETTKIDSAAAENPQGQAATLLPLLKALTGNAFTVTMTPRGDIKDVEVPEAIVEALKNQPGAAQMGDLATPEGFKKLVRQASFILPEKLEPGSEWSTTTESNFPAVGTQSAKFTYRYEGPKEVNDKPAERFTVKVETKFAGGETPVEVTTQAADGEVLFNRDAGRLESSSIDQHLKLKITVGGQVISQDMELSTTMKWVPENEEEGEPK